MLAQVAVYGADVEVGAGRGSPVLHLVHLNLQCLLQITQRHLRLIISY